MKKIFYTYYKLNDEELTPTNKGAASEENDILDRVSFAEILNGQQDVKEELKALTVRIYNEMWNNQGRLDISSATAEELQRKLLSLYMANLSALPVNAALTRNARIASLNGRKIAAMYPDLLWVTGKDGTVRTCGTFEKKLRKTSESWTDIKNIAAGYNNVIGLRRDGSVAVCGKKIIQRCSEWTNIERISLFLDHVHGIKKDGTLVSNKYNVVTDGRITAFVENYLGYLLLKENGCIETSAELFTLNKWTNIIDIAAGDNHFVGLNDHGTVRAVGDNSRGQCNVSKWTDIIAIAAGSIATIGLRNDGTVVSTAAHITACVNGWRNVAAIAIDSGYNVIGITDNGEILSSGNIDTQKIIAAYPDITPIS